MSPPCWVSLTSQIDYEKLAAFASMSNPRSASNAWAKLKPKLMTNPDGVVPATPKKGGAKKKAAAAKDENGDEGESTPKKTPRKRAAKKQDVDGDASPKKKTARGKKASDNESGECNFHLAYQLYTTNMNPAKVKAESEESEDLKPNDSPVKAESVEESVEDEV